MIKNIKIDLETIQSAVTLLGNSHEEVELVYLFGSVARGATHRFSDVDLAFYITPSKYAALKSPLDYRLSILQEFHSKGIKGEVELVLMNGAPILLNLQIIKYGKLIHEKMGCRRDQIEIAIRQRYCDTKYLRRLKESVLKKKIASMKNRLMIHG